MYIYSSDDIAYINYLSCSIWINNKCKELVSSSGFKYYDFIELDKQLTRRILKDVREISVDIDFDQIIVVIKYLQAKRPYQVLFVNLYNEPSAHDFYVQKAKNNV